MYAIFFFVVNCVGFCSKMEMAYAHKMSIALCNKIIEKY